MTKSELNNFLIVLDRQKTYEIVPKIFKLTIGEPIGLRRIKFLKIIFSLRIISEHSIVQWNLVIKRSDITKPLL